MRPDINVETAKMKSITDINKRPARQLRSAQWRPDVV